MKQHTIRFDLFFFLLFLCSVCVCVLALHCLFWQVHFHQERDSFSLSLFFFEKKRRKNRITDTKSCFSGMEGFCMHEILDEECIQWTGAATLPLDLGVENESDPQFACNFECKAEIDESFF